MLNLSSYGSQVRNSGDVVVRDTTSSLHYRLDTTSSTHSAYVIGGDGLAQEATREEHIFVPETVSGRYTSSCLRSDGAFPTMAITLDTNPESTTIKTNDTSATFSQGLSFDSNESAIYFGASKTFRMRFLSEEPKRFVFQYLEPSTSEYVTKFSCAKN